MRYEIENLISFGFGDGSLELELIAIEMEA